MDVPRLINFSQPSFHFPTLRASDRGDQLSDEVCEDRVVEEPPNSFQTLVFPGCFLAIAGETANGFFIVEAVTEVIQMFR